MLVGLVVAFTAGWRIYRGGSLRSDAVVGLAGVWLLVSPFVLDAQNTAVHTADRMLAIVAGGVLIVLSVASALLWRLDRKRTRQPVTRGTTAQTANAAATRPSPAATSRRRRKA
ncbi:hypothetical protein [Streptomyces roseolus]